MFSNEEWTCCLLPPIEPSDSPSSKGRYCPAECFRQIVSLNWTTDSLDLRIVVVAAVVIVVDDYDDDGDDDGVVAGCCRVIASDYD